MKSPSGKEGGEGRKPTELQILVHLSDNSHQSSGKVRGHHTKQVPQNLRGARVKNFHKAM